MARSEGEPAVKVAVIQVIGAIIVALIGGFVSGF